MSNQRTPNENRSSRRYVDISSKSLFVDKENTKKEKKQSSKNLGLFKNRKKIKNQDEIITSQRKTPKHRYTGKDHIPVQIFEPDTKGEKERRKRRTKNKTKAFVFFGVSLICFLVILAGSIFLFSDNEPKAEDKLFADIESIAATKNKVTIHHNSTTKEIYTNAQTVGEVFAENDIAIADDQKSSHDDDALVQNDMEIFISEPIVVSFIQNGISNSVTVYGGRVSDVIAALEIELDENDIVEPSVDTFVTDEMQISYIDVEVTEITVVEDMPYETQEGETSTVESGYYHVEQEGKKGTIQVTYMVTTVDKIEQSREEISRTIVEEATNRIILWGTATPSGGGSSGSYDDIVVNNPGQQTTSPSVPASPSDFIETMSGHVTAYTHTGSTTATGTWPRSTRTLENPGSCAVVPGTIPYGSLLYVTGYGYCIAEDTGAFRHNPDRWNQIDLFMNTVDECLNWGRRRDVNVYILRRGY